MATPEALLDQIFNEDSEPVPREVWQQQQLLRQQHVLQQQLLMLQQQQLLLHWRQQQQHKQHMKEEPLDEHDAYRQVLATNENRHTRRDTSLCQWG